MTATMSTTSSEHESLLVLLRALKLPTIARHADEVAQKAEQEGMMRFIHQLVQILADLLNIDVVQDAPVGEAHDGHVANL